MSVSGLALAEDGTIYATGQEATSTTRPTGSLIAFGPNGIIKWRFNSKGEVAAGPAVRSDGTIWFGAQQLTDPRQAPPVLFYGVDDRGRKTYGLTRKTPEPAAEIRGVLHPPAIDRDGSIVFSGGNRELYRLQPSARLDWVFKTGPFAMPSPLPSSLQTGQSTPRLTRA